MELPTKIVWILVAIFIGIAITQIDFSGETEQEEEKPAEEKVVDKAFHTQDLSTFVTALKTANIDDELNNGQAITIFAPSDVAFSTLPEGRFAEMMQTENKEELKKILNYHIVPRAISTHDLKNGQVFETIQGEKIKISLSDDEDQAKVNGTTLVKTNIRASNGIIHVINKVMMPSASSAKAQAAL